MNDKSANSSSAEIRALRKQVAALEKQVAKLDKAVQAASKPRRLHAKKVVANSLEIVDSSGKLVAEIGGRGDVFCRTVRVSTDKNKRGVFINGIHHGAYPRSISAGVIHLLGPQGGIAAIEIDGATTSAGQIKLRNVDSKQRLDLQARGAALIAHDENGDGTVIIASNGASGGSITVNGKGSSAKARVYVGISPSTNGGYVGVLDAAGKLKGSLGL